MNVVVPCFNEAKHIPRFLRGMAAQEQRPHKVTLVDDASSDESCEVFQQYARELELRYSVVKNDSNIGPIRNFRLALSIMAAESTPSCFLSLHEEYYPNHIRTLSEESLRRDGYSTIYTPCDYKDLKTGTPLRFQNPDIDTQGLSSEEALFKVITNYTYAAPLWSHHHQSALRKSIPFPFDRGGDHALLASLSLHGEIIYCQTVTYCRYFDTDRTHRDLLQFESSQKDRSQPSPWGATPWLSFWENHYHAILQAHKSILEKRELLKIAARAIAQKSGQMLLREIEICRKSPGHNLLATGAATTAAGALEL